MRIAIVEDNARLARVIQEALDRAGLVADVFDSLSDATYALASHDYRALVLDRALPDGEGLSLLRRLRQAGNPIPCLVLTARDAIHDRVDGLDSGADDYLPKPFALEELIARVRAMLRRRPITAPLRFEIGDLTVDAHAARASVAGQTLELSAGEFRLLLILAEAEGGTVARERLADAAFGPFAEITPNSLEVAVHRLRRRLRTAGATATLVNLRGIGYALKSASSA